MTPNWMAMLTLATSWISSAPAAAQTIVFVTGSHVTLRLRRYDSVAMWQVIASSKARSMIVFSIFLIALFVVIYMILYRRSR